MDETIERYARSFFHSRLKNPHAPCTQGTSPFSPVHPDPSIPSMKFVLSNVVTFNLPSENITFRMRHEATGRQQLRNHILLATQTAGRRTRYHRLQFRCTPNPPSSLPSIALFSRKSKISEQHTRSTSTTSSLFSCCPARHISLVFAVILSPQL